MRSFVIKLTRWLLQPSPVLTLISRRAKRLLTAQPDGRSGQGLLSSAAYSQPGKTQPARRASATRGDQRASRPATFSGERSSRDLENRISPSTGDRVSTLRSAQHQQPAQLNSLTFPAAITSPVLLLYLLIAGASAPTIAQESPTYVMDSVSLAVAGSESSSRTYEVQLSLGALSTPGAASACNDGYDLRNGHVFGAGEGTVPIRLEVRREGATLVLLSWSGVDTRFHIYRSDSPVDLVNPINEIAQSDQCNFADVFSGPAIVFYSVVRDVPDFWETEDAPK